MEGNNSKYYEVCIAKSDGVMYPVYMPLSHSISVGDIVIFDGRQGSVVYETVTAKDSDLWTLMVLLMGKSPIRVKQFAYLRDVEPEEDDEG